ncbi:hypothetical protein PMAYCL1PPCAC_05109, partial [Pristionchus mayeri]
SRSVRAAQDGREQSALKVVHILGRSEFRQIVVDSAPSARCDPITGANGLPYANPCVTTDPGAVCNENATLPQCTCTYMSTGDFCE